MNSQLLGRAAGVGTSSPPTHALVDALSADGETFAVSFAGQGSPAIDALADLHAHHPSVRELVARAEAVAAAQLGHATMRWSGLYPHGLPLTRWLTEPSSRPSVDHLVQSHISHPLVFLASVARYLVLLESGLEAAVRRGGLVAMTGHSQGVVAALLFAEAGGLTPGWERVDHALTYILWQGFWTQRGRPAHAGPGPCMVAVSGPREAELAPIVAAVNATLPARDALHVSLQNTPTRAVISATPAALEALRGALERRRASDLAARKARRRGGRVLDWTWEALAVGTPFHAPYMAGVRDRMRETVATLGLRFGAPQVPVAMPCGRGVFAAGDDGMDRLVDNQFVEPVRWCRTLRRLAADARPDHLVDCGPGDGVAKLAASSLRGLGVSVVPAATVAGQETLLTAGVPRPAAPDWSVYAPRVATLPDGQQVLDTAYTRFTGQSPVILAGMTPTTADVPICAAAANAGFTAELAGGGQVTEAVFDARMEELVEALEPGAEVVFNALVLDPWLFGLHLGDRALVQRARRQGVPLRGVTFSGGVPELPEALRLLDALAALGMHHNAFKPGTVAQVDQVVQIAEAAPQHRIVVHLEGGRAGGHHSWEDLDALLLATYARLRAQPNVLLAVGGGIADEARAVDLLTGRWAEAHGEPRMPVDAVFLGTVAMAAREACTSASVKAALVEAAGTPAWVGAGRAEGGVTSGRSGLDADVHYLDNAAARCARLLDAVAGDAEAVAARREEIVAALAQTAKPYFGDLGAMTYGVMLDRLVELMAVGRGGRYEDGPWPDVSYRTRMLDAIRRAEARCHPEDRGTAPSVVAHPDELDDPHGVLARLRAALPEVDTQPVHPADEDWFVRDLCARPGKPVCFVPTLDEDVRRWYASDALWQSHDDRYTADQVLALPGPAAVAGIQRVDEPIAALLGRFEAAAVARLQAEGAAPQGRAVRAGPATPAGAAEASEDGVLRLDGAEARGPRPWCDALADGFAGPIAALFGAETILEGRRTVPNPVRRLVEARPGATLEVRHGGGVIEAATWRDAARRETLRVEARTDAVALVLDADDGPSLLLLLRAWRRPEGWRFALDPAAHEAALRGFYAATLGTDLPVVAPFTEAVAQAALGVEVAEAHAALTGGTGRRADLAFSAAWPAVIRAIATEGFGRDMLRLVHLEHRVERLGPIEALAGPIEARARLTDRVAEAGGRTLRVEATLHGEDGAGVARLVERFFVRDAAAVAGAARSARTVDATRRLADPGAVAFLTGQPWLTPAAELAAGDTIRVEATVRWAREGDRATAEADGVVRRGDAVVGTIALREEGALEAHPLLAVLELLADDGVRTVVRRTLATVPATAPRELRTFAEVGGDRNPLHTRHLVARLAGHDAPIVHGMWSSAALQGAVVSAACDGEADRLDRWQARFLDAVRPGESLELEVVRTGVEHGALWIEATAYALREGRVPVVQARARVSPPRTAVVFPGQGIQRQGMGMDGYAASRAARAVWDRADAHTRSLGFSILHVVRDNPTHVRVGDETFAHPDGVLHLTRFTQVAMAVLAAAQVAQLREEGLLGDDGVFAGHSIGEYNALGALAEVLPLETVLEVVYQRGATMEALVPRDAEGRSPYAMAAVRPAMARLDEAGLLALVEEVAAEHGFLEVVNHNVRDLQYAVAGERAALSELERRVLARVPPGGKPAWTLVPGIDVPFHSSRLVEGVPAFRALLDAVLPERLAWRGLVGRYVPNLVARPFALTADFVGEMARVTGSADLERLADTLEERAPDDLARTLVVELLAWQFASPVRWIETQELLFRPVSDGGLGVRRLLEVGVAHQPTVRNMARHTLRGWPGGPPPVVLLNVGADAERVRLRDGDPEPVVEAPVDEAPPASPTPAPVPNKVAAAPSTPSGPIPDSRMPLRDALRALLALQVDLRVDQIRDDETVDELCAGVSSKRNQVLLDLGAEFGVGAIDGAHERPLPALETQLAQRCGAYAAPGPFLGAAVDDALKRRLAGLSRREAEGHLASTWGLGPGLQAQVLVGLALGLRDGTSSRGGELGTVAPADTRAEALARLDDRVRALAETLGLPLAVAAPASEAADPAAVADLREALLGWDGALMVPFRALAERLGHPVGPEGLGLSGSDVDAARLAVLDAEVGSRAAERLAPAFDARRHVAFTDAWSLARRDVVALAFDGLAGRLDAAAIATQAARLARFADDPDVAATARWYARRAEGSLRAALEAIARGDAPACPPVSRSAFLDGLWADEATAPRLPDRAALEAALGEGLTAPWDFRGRTAVVTGASPGSIALEVVRHLLRGGARVVVTTSRPTRERVEAYREVYRQDAGPGAELHVVPFNQASRQDVDALVDWLFARVTETAGAETRERKPAFAPDLLLPFAAGGDVATLDGVGPDAELGLRTLLHGVERLTTAVARRYLDDGLLPEPCQVLLPLSPNHGTFGGDGLYGEAKAGLEAMVARWRSEHAAWGRAVSLTAATIGWVRGTGLMAGNDAVASAVTAHTGARTFAASEMGWLLAALCTPALRRAAADAPLRVDLSGGLGRAEGLAAVVRETRAVQAAEDAARRSRAALDEALARRLGGVPPLPPVALLPRLEGATAPASDGWRPEVDLARTVVVVGMGEIGPCGTSRTRRALEVGDRLAPAAVLELAWMTGLVRYDRHLAGGSWVDVASGEVVPEAAIADRYEEAVRSRTGVRILTTDAVGYDPDDRPVLETVRLDRDLRFEVGSEDEARSFLRADPDHTRVAQQDGVWWVTRTAGAQLRVPRSARLTRRVGGALPDGFDLARWGIGPELAAAVDPLALLNLVATVEAFASAGLTPEALLRHVHPARVANTQGSGMGGAASLRRMYTDPLLGERRKHDALQESLGNVVAAWAVQSYVGSYGPMTHPVAACATAAVSVECAVDKILAGKADVVLAGGFDDLSAEGQVGFADMHATADTAEMLALGLEPDQMSRANDVRRRGFVEAEGGGSLLLARGDVAARLGLPVHGVIAYAGSFGDGVHTSIPAPGRGLLAAGCGGEASPLGRALSTWGLTADDIGLVYKHDTSTAANDPNEAALHHTLQEVLGRTRGNPLLVVSQKTLTGHAKGGAAAWQLVGLAQAMAEGVVPGNRNLTDLDPALRPHAHLLHTDRTLRPGPAVPLRAGLVTSLGFGHVSAMVLMLHPDAFLAALPEADRDAYAAAAARRRRAAERWTWQTWLGHRVAFTKRTDRRVDSDDAEVALLLDPSQRLGDDGRFGSVGA